MTTHHNLLLRNAVVFDGTGAPPTTADVAVDHGVIADVGSLDARTAELEIDVAGLAVAPGFIDVHTHDDFAVLSHPDMSFKSRGGVTTCIVGNCGFGAAPHAAAVKMLGALAPGAVVPYFEGHAGYAQAIERIVPGVNVGMLAGHGTLRLAAMGPSAGAPDGAHLRRMKDDLHEALDAGALGLSSGLIYDPGRHADTAELIELAAEMRGSGGLYATHMRSEAEGLIASVEEAITIGREAGVAVQISHLKAAGRDNWGRVGGALALIEQAQAAGLDVHADQYPYTAGSTSLQALIENGVFDGDATRGGLGAIDAGDIVVASAPGHAEWEGRSIEALAKAFGCAAATAAAQVAEQAPGTTVVLHTMSEADVQTVMRHPAVMIGSDGLPTLDGKPHPRLYNTFARVLGHYARDVGVFDLTTAVHRMTGFAASKFGLADRGTVRPGHAADLVVFDPRRIVDRGTFEDPNRYPAGISHVFVNGQAVVRDGEPTGIRAGAMLRRGGGR